MHSGSRVLQGTKYILKTELIFKRVSASVNGSARLAHLQDPQYVEARRLYDQSIRFESGGQREQFVDTYREVLAKQCAASHATHVSEAQQCTAIPGLQHAVVAALTHHHSDGDGRGVAAGNNAPLQASLAGSATNPETNPEASDPLPTGPAVESMRLMDPATTLRARIEVRNTLVRCLSYLCPLDVHQVVSTSQSMRRIGQVQYSIRPLYFLYTPSIRPLYTLYTSFIHPLYTLYTPSICTVLTIHAM
jgi:hypothetical protein